MLERDHPVVFTEAEGWSSEFLRSRMQRLGAAPVTVALLDAGRMRVGERDGVRTETLPLHRALTRVQRGERYLITPVAGAVSDLVRRDELESVVGRRRFTSARLWVSPAGAETPLHQDLPHNVLIQLQGTKRVWLAPPDEARRLGRYSRWSRAPNFAHADLETRDPARWPELERVMVYQCDLRPGELLFIPSRWWHQVRSLEASISVSTWFADGPLALLSRAAQRYAEWRGVRPRDPETTRRS